MKNQTQQKNVRGFSLAEVLVSTAIFVVVGLAIANFGQNIFSLNTSLQNNLSAQLDGRLVLKKIIAELRSASPSNLGGYPIESAGTSSLVFYSNVDSDSYKERIRYYLVGTVLYRGQIKPSGSPLTYPSGSEKISTVVRDVRNTTSTPIFDYFNGNYAGTTSPLSMPVTPSDVRLIKVTVTIDADPNRSPNPIIISSQGMLRNLKDNF